MSVFKVAPCALLFACGQMYQSPGGANAQPSPTEPASTYAEPRAGQGAPAVTPSGPQQPPANPPPRASVQPRSTGPALAPYAQQFIDAHNQHRAKHCAAPLTWSIKLAVVAEGWAKSLKDAGCKFEHSKNPYGENLAAGTTGTLPPDAVVDMWYDEVAKYPFPNGGFSMATGHFTQVVWRNTTEVGCGVAQCNGMDIWVCNYNPYGNVTGEFKTQVLPQGCK